MNALAATSSLERLRQWAGAAANAATRPPFRSREVDSFRPQGSYGMIIYSGEALKLPVAEQPFGRLPSHVKLARGEESVEQRQGPRAIQLEGEDLGRSRRMKEETEATLNDLAQIVFEKLHGG